MSYFYFYFLICFKFSINGILNSERHPAFLSISEQEVLVMLKTIRNLLADESGATAIEYGLIAALVSVAGIVALEAMGTSLSDMFGVVSSKLDGAVAKAQSTG